MAAENFWQPWENKLAQIRAQIASLASTNLSSPSSAPPPVDIPRPTNQKQEASTIQVNAQTNLSFQGYTADQVQTIVTQAKDRFGDELLAALQSANVQFGF